MKLASALALVLATSTASAQTIVPTGPKTLPYDEDQPIPPGYHLEKRARKGLVIGGSITFGVGWLATALVSGLSSRNSDARRYGWIPLAGPFAVVAANPTGKDVAGFLALGAIQAGGAAMFVLGLVAKKDVLVRNEFSASVVPFAPGPNAGGLGLVGAF